MFCNTRSIIYLIGIFEVRRCSKRINGISNFSTDHVIVILELQQTFDSIFAVFLSCSAFSTYASWSHDWKPPLLQVSTVSFYSVLDDFHQFLKMTSVIRKVGVVHNCSYSNLCHYDNATRRVNHCTTTTAGGSFYLITKWMGYPPRRS